jgi:hypothetical protein
VSGSPANSLDFSFAIVDLRHADCRDTTDRSLTYASSIDACAPSGTLPTSSIVAGDFVVVGKILSRSVYNEAWHPSALLDVTVSIKKADLGQTG